MVTFQNLWYWTVDCYINYVIGLCHYGSEVLRSETSTLTKAFFSCQLIRNNTVKFEDFLVINNWESLILQWVTLLLIALTARTLTQEEGV